MKIKLIHAHFLISIGNYSNERIGFTVELDEGETPESVVPQLREQATAIVGSPAEKIYSEMYEADRACRELKVKLEKLRKEWDATAEFLRAQGIRPEAPSMPQFSNLLQAAVEEETVVEGEVPEGADAAAAPAEAAAPAKGKAEGGGKGKE